MTVLKNSYNDNNSVIKFKCSYHVMTAELSIDENKRRPWLTTKVYVMGKVPGSLARRVIFRVEHKF